MYYSTSVTYTSIRWAGLNPQHACTGGLQYLMCVCVCVCDIDHTPTIMGKATHTGKSFLLLVLKKVVEDLDVNISTTIV